MTPDKRVEEIVEKFINWHRTNTVEEIPIALRELLTQYHQDLMSEVVKMKKNTDELVPLDNYEHPEYDQAIGYNQAIDDIIKSLSK